MLLLETDVGTALAIDVNKDAKRVASTGTSTDIDTDISIHKCA